MLLSRDRKCYYFCTLEFKPIISGEEKNRRKKKEIAENAENSLKISSLQQKRYVKRSQKFKKKKKNN